MRSPSPRRACRCRIGGTGRAERLIAIAAERLPELLRSPSGGGHASRPSRRRHPARVVWERHAAIVELLRGRLCLVGPDHRGRAGATRSPSTRSDADARASRARSRKASCCAVASTAPVASGASSRMVRSRAARAHPPLHAQPAARGDRAGQPGRLHAVPVQVAARRSRRSAGRTRRTARGADACSTASSLPRRRGNARCFLPASTATSRRCSTCCAWLARSAGRGSRRGRPSSTEPAQPHPGHADRALSARAQRGLAGPAARSSDDPEAQLTDNARRVLERAALAEGHRSSTTCAPRAASTPKTRGSALGTLVASGFAASDGFAGLRALLVQRARPSDRARSSGELRRPLEPHSDAARAGGRGQCGRGRSVGAATPLRRGLSPPADSREHRRAVARSGPRLPAARSAGGDPRRTLRRRECRESSSPCREPSSACARCVGRRGDGRLLAIGTADPLNLAGIVTAGDRIRAPRRNRLAYRDGVPIAVIEGGVVRPLVTLDEPVRREITAALRARRPAAAVAHV